MNERIGHRTAICTPDNSRMSVQGDSESVDVERRASHAAVKPTEVDDSSCVG